MSQYSDHTADDERAPVAYELTALDRCDSCGAQAYVRATVATGQLFFCAHHGAQFKDKLAPTALEWHDESARLLEHV